jgi:SnoaL-like domain
VIRRGEAASALGRRLTLRHMQHPRERGRARAPPPDPRVRSCTETLRKPVSSVGGSLTGIETFVPRPTSAFGQGDMAAFAEVMADNIEWVDPGDPDDDPNAGTFKGKEAVLGWLGGLALTLDYTTFEPREFIAQNDQGRIPGVLRGNGSGHRPRVCQS